MSDPDLLFGLAPPRLQLSLRVYRVATCLRQRQRLGPRRSFSTRVVSHGDRDHHHHQHHHGEDNVDKFSSFKSALTIARESLRVSLGSAGGLALAFVLASGLGRKAKVVGHGLLGLVLVMTGVPAVVDSMEAVLHRRDVNVDVLMTVAAFAAVGTGSPFEGALLMVLYAVSHAAESAVTAKARGDLDALRELSPEMTTKVQRSGSQVAYGSAEEVPVAEIVVGDLVLVRAGEVLPCDGIVVDGSAFLMMAHLTGESRLQSRNVGDEVLAGVRAVDGSLVVEVTKVNKDSAVARIVRMVTDAQKNRPRVQSAFIDKFGRTYSRVILGLTAGMAMFLPFLARAVRGNTPGRTMAWIGPGGSIVRSLGFLVVSSPCALLIGAPVAYLSALSVCARRGVLVKGGAKTLEAVGNVRHVAFDKTGTLTTGELELHSMAGYLPSGNVEEEYVNGNEGVGEAWTRALSVASVLEAQSTHPIAKAILRASKALNGQNVPVQDFRSIAGRGVQAKITKNYRLVDVAVGRLEWVASFPFVTEDAKNWASQQEKYAMDRGYSIACLAIEGESLSVLRFRDVIRPEAKIAIDSLRTSHIRLSVLTGDLPSTTQAIQVSLGPFDDIRAGLTPDEKLHLVQQWTAAASSEPTSALQPVGSFLMVGDGINDAPALAAATAGLAMGFTSATSVYAADVVLVRSDLRDISWFRRKAAATHRVVLQNLALALGIMMFTSAASVLGHVPLWLAVALHEGSTLLVGLNSLRLLTPN